MICYQDEKMYGPAPDNITPEQLEQSIRTLEIELYGHTIEEPTKPVKAKIYDVIKKKLVDVENVTK